MEAGNTATHFMSAHCEKLALRLHRVKVEELVKVDERNDAEMRHDHQGLQVQPLSFAREGDCDGIGL